MFYSASNAKLKFNNEEILASNAQISLNAQVDPNYVAGARHSQTFNASNGIEGQLSFSYYLTGTDYFKSFITGQGEAKDNSREIVPNPISGNFGGLGFDSGYLESYSVNFSPNAPAVADASIKFFDDLTGIFQPSYEGAPDSTEILNFSNAIVLSQLEIPGNYQFVEGTFNYNSQVEGVYLAEETKPSSVTFGPKNVNMNFEVDNPGGSLPFEGSPSRIEVGLKKPNNQAQSMGNWTLRPGPSNSNYSPFSSSSNNGDVSATWNGGGPTSYGIADSTPFVANQNEIFSVSFDLNVTDGDPPSFQLINQEGSTKKGWSTVQSLSNGTNSFDVTVSATSSSTVIGTGNYGTFQIFNNSESAWLLTNLKVVRTSTQPSELFTCSGVLQSRNIASTAESYVKQTINIVQNNSAVTEIFVANSVNAQGDESSINNTILA